MCPKVEHEMNPQLRPFVQIVNTLAVVLGDEYEILLHDTGQLESSIVACANGHVTGRNLGSPMTGYGLELLNSGKFEKNNGVYTYMARANNGTLIKCGVIGLKDEDGRIIGLLCIHVNIEKALVLKKMLDTFFSVSDTAEKDEPINEFFGLEIEDVFSNALNEIKSSIKKPFSELSKHEKKEVVRILQGKGFFMMKGAVDYVANEMGNSKFTIYAYIRELEREKNG